MLFVTEDRKRSNDQGQIFVELTKNRELSISNCDRLGYWCDKEHLRHFILELSRVFSDEELKDLLCKRLGK